uniref:Uncharacterized protein n=1 Tax=Cacopsylla melanoneura TaxID=428564 RepID=A0A8D8ZC94_9HEMI
MKYHHKIRTVTLRRTSQLGACSMRSLALDHVEHNIPIHMASIPKCKDCKDHNYIPIPTSHLTLTHRKGYGFMEDSTTVQIQIPKSRSRSKRSTGFRRPFQHKVSAH